MAKFDSTHCEAGRKVLIGLLSANGYSRGILCPEVASGINAELQLGPDDPCAWTPADVKCAMASQAFDLPGQHEFFVSKGRAGGIKEYDLDSDKPVEDEPEVNPEAESVAA
jgi:hypothetical protein